MTKFKVGDKFRCLKDRSGAKVGDIIALKEHEDTSDDEGCKLFIPTTPDGKNGFWPKNEVKLGYFELIEKEVIKPPPKKMTREEEWGF